MTKTKTLEELIKEYNLTNNEDILSYIFEDYRGFIIYKIRVYNLLSCRDLAIAYAQESIWKSLKYYKPGKKTANNYIKHVIEKGLQNLLVDLNRGKAIFNREAISINQKINETTEESKEYEYYALIDKEANPETIYLERVETQEKIKDLIIRLSKTEKDVFIAYIKTFKPTPQGKANIDEIIELTNYDKKKIDNALQRIKKKASENTEPKLTKEKAIKIYNIYQKYDITQKQLASNYNLSKMIVNLIVNKKHKYTENIS